MSVEALFHGCHYTRTGLVLLREELPEHFWVTNDGGRLEPRSPRFTNLVDDVLGERCGSTLFRANHSHIQLLKLPLDRIVMFPYRIREYLDGRDDIHITTGE